LKKEVRRLCAPVAPQIPVKKVEGYKNINGKHRYDVHIAKLFSNVFQKEGPNIGM
jgi:hypothetical protein